MKANYLDLFTENPSTNTLRVIQEQTKSLSFEWKPMKHDSFKYVYLENSAGYFWKTERYIEAGDIGNLPTIGKPCEAITYKAEGYYSGILGYASLFSTYNIEYERGELVILLQLFSIISCLCIHVFCTESREESA
ncbi:unnamed protein product [Schistosoma mattheei]|uniref:Uncharacterized protein n=1 Tax=Schistosoma mattheei TaxID=31246 RepID=A0AA85ASJ0_9TREM|nr:unnamed protein product [Schistosoma mattheei]